MKHNEENINVRSGNENKIIIYTKKHIPYQQISIKSELI